MATVTRTPGAQPAQARWYLAARLQDLEPDGQSREFHAWSEQRSRVLPGITGLWQIRGRSDLSFAEMIDDEMNR